MSGAASSERRTSADIVYDTLYDEITSLVLMPGNKLSEAEIAQRFEISRQPVRDAFNRLGNLGLIRIQPQRATVVEKFSLNAIEAARFARLAIELELVREATLRWSNTTSEAFEKNLAEQRSAARDGDARMFHTLDEEFHALIADIAEQPEAHELVLQKKAMVDRICVLSLKKAHEMEELVSDHNAIFQHMERNEAQKAVDVMRQHLSRIEKTIQSVHKEHAEFFQS